MKAVGVRDLKEHLSGVLSDSQRESVMVMNHGRPIAMVIGIEGTDPSDAVLAEVHRRRMTREVMLTGDEVADALGISPAEMARARRAAQRRR